LSYKSETRWRHVNPYCEKQRRLHIFFYSITLSSARGESPYFLNIFPVVVPILCDFSKVETTVITCVVYGFIYLFICLIIYFLMSFWHFAP